MMGRLKCIWRWAALLSFVAIAATLAVLPSASRSAAASGGLVSAPGGPYAAAGGTDLAFSPQGHWLATGGDGVSLFGVDERTGQLQLAAHVDLAAPGEVSDVAFSPDGRFLAVGATLPATNKYGLDGWLFIYAVNPLTGALRQVAARLAVYAYGSAVDIAFDPAGRFLAFTGLCGVHIFAFNRPSGALRKVPDSSYFTGDWCPSGVTFNPAGNLLAVTRGYGPWLYKVDQRTGRLTKTAEWSFGSDQIANSFFSPDGRLLAVLSGDCGLYVLSVEDGRRLAEVSGSPFLVRSCPSYVAFSPDGRMIATATGSTPPKIALAPLDEQTGAIQAPRGTPVGTDGGYPESPLAFSPNGKLLVVGNGDPYTGGMVSVFFALSACADPDGDNDCDR